MFTEIVLFAAAHLTEVRLNARSVIVAAAVVISLMNCREAEGAVVDSSFDCPDGCPELLYTRDWVVSPTGSDSAAGTATQPFRTITRAVSMANPGERIVVNAGT